MSDYGRVEHQRRIVGYHGCDWSTVKAVLSDREHLEPSDNAYDWLGTGIYFWEFGPTRALEFARKKSDRGEIDEPAILGAYIDLGRCFDLADVEHTRELGEAFEVFKETFDEEGLELPENREPEGDESELLLRFRDCAVIDFQMDKLDDEYEYEYAYQTVRGVFQEGDVAFPGAEIRTKSHIQVAVRETSCILGYFLPAFRFEDGGEDE